MENSVLFYMNLLELILVGLCIGLTINHEHDRSGALDPEVNDFEAEQ